MAEIVKAPIATKLTLTKEAIDAGNVIVPEGYELKKKPDPNQAIRDEIARLEEQLAQMSEPDEKELIEYGKTTHPYFEIKNRLDNLKSYGNNSI
ncbi:MAG: hypothetical protein GX459_03135 [Bacteroidales bacterium]|nr:hypothetical protein [Bacteroidales bacterium]